MIHRQYPQLVVDLDKFEYNARRIVSDCHRVGVSVAGVIKGFHANPVIARLYRQCGISQLATSRLEHIEKCREAGIAGPYMLLRIPMMSEIPDLVRLADYSLESELSVMEAINLECRRQGKTHKVVIMAELGDLREGFWDREELLQACLTVEQQLEHLTLAGVGVLLGCYGAIAPTAENMAELVSIAERVEQHIGRKLEIVSGGTSFTYPLVLDGTLPPKVNHLRIGEGAMMAHDIKYEYGVSGLEDIHSDVFTVWAEVLEVKVKPSHPIGKIMVDSFGNHPVFEDRGLRRRALLGIGRVDLGSFERLVPLGPGITVLGGSSDHLILDVEDYAGTLRPGDILGFTMDYTAALFATGAPGMNIRFIGSRAKEL